MGQVRQTVQLVTLDAAGGAADTQRVWDAPVSEPVEQTTIWLNSNGEITGAGNLAWEVFYGGRWNGAPFSGDVTHLDGISQAAGNILGGTEICEMIHEDLSYIPQNANIPTGSGIQDSSRPGFPIVVELTNLKVVPVTVRVIFLSKSVSDKV